MNSEEIDQDSWYRSAARVLGPGIKRLASAYEADIDKRRDLAQEIHVALWRSHGQFRGDCSLKTWGYRIAHNVGASYILKQKRSQTSKWVAIEEAAEIQAPDDIEAEVDVLQMRVLLLELIFQLKVPDRQIMHLYLEGCDASEIAEITNISSGNVATKIHRVKAVLAQAFDQGKQS